MVALACPGSFPALASFDSLDYVLGVDALTRPMPAHSSFSFESGKQFLLVHFPGIGSL